MYIDAELALREIRTKYNHKTDVCGIDPQFPLDCTSGALERGYMDKKDGALYASGYKDHLVDFSMHESAVYQIFLNYQA
jgi:hypothetical protein